MYHVYTSALNITRYLVNAKELFLCTMRVIKIVCPRYTGKGQLSKDLPQIICVITTVSEMHITIILLGTKTLLAFLRLVT